MKRGFVQRFYRISKKEIGYLRFLVEGYDGLLFMRTLDSGEGFVEFRYAPSMGGDAENVLRAIAAELSMQELGSPPPDRYPFP